MPEFTVGSQIALFFHFPALSPLAKKDIFMLGFETFRLYPLRGYFVASVSLFI
jgi:hypothetical protein